MNGALITLWLIVGCLVFTLARLAFDEWMVGREVKRQRLEGSSPRSEATQ